ncbi:helix-turn-helix domain-containing protein [Actinomadura adrarensis]|uniref:Helix-turn-helix domain-containing protein n=1 Tax=Actinomadura adrarensis TaxID=1819600 RepID=A0ABW3CBH9_9ACTN
MTPEDRRALGRKIRARRDALGLTQREIAERLLDAIPGPQRPALDVAESYIKRWEAGRAGLGKRYRRALVQALSADEDFQFGDEPAAPKAETDDERRRLLASLSVLGVDAAVTHEPMEPIRQALTTALPGAAAARMVADWEEAAFEHGHAFLTTPPRVLLPALAHDLVRLQSAIRAARGAQLRRDLCGPAGKLAALVAMTIATVGEARQARDWWVTARHTADSSNDLDLRVWVRGYEAMSSLYAGRPLSMVLRRADEALEIAGDGSGAAVLEAMAGRAQALAVIGRAAEAEAMIRIMEDRFSRLPQTTPDERLSTGAWPETGLRHTAAFTYTYTRNAAEADRAQAAALALYPTTMPRQRAQVELLRATCLVQSGDVGEGIEHAARTVKGLSREQRTSTIRRGARMVVEAVPKSKQTEPALIDLREVLALPAVRPTGGGG